MGSITVTFLFTDIEGSTRRWEESPATMRLALADHDALLRTSIQALEVENRNQVITHASEEGAAARAKWSGRPQR